MPLPRAGRVRHAAVPITRGRRMLLVGFVDVHELTEAARASQAPPEPEPLGGVSQRAT